MVTQPPPPLKKKIIKQNNKYYTYSIDIFDKGRIFQNFVIFSLFNPYLHTSVWWTLKQVLLEIANSLLEVVK